MGATSKVIPVAFRKGDIVRSAMLGRLGRVRRAGSATATIEWTVGGTSQVMQHCSPSLVEILDPATTYGASIKSYVDACLREPRACQS